MWLFLCFADTVGRTASRKTGRYTRSIAVSDEGYVLQNIRPNDRSCRLTSSGTIISIHIPFHHRSRQTAPHHCLQAVSQSSRVITALLLRRHTEFLPRMQHVHPKCHRLSIWRLQIICKRTRSDIHDEEHNGDVYMEIKRC